MKPIDYSKSIMITGALTSLISTSLISEGNTVVFHWRREFRGPKLLSKILGNLLANPLVKVQAYITDVDLRTLKFKAISSGKPIGINENDRTNVPQVGWIQYNENQKGCFRLELAACVKHPIW